MGIWLATLFIVITVNFAAGKLAYGQQSDAASIGVNLKWLRTEC